MAKKFQLSELKVTSFVTALNTGEQKTAKGGFLGARRALVNHRVLRGDWTSDKTFVKSFSSVLIEGDQHSSKRK